MPNVVLPPKSKRRIPELLFLILAIITLALIAANAALRRSINESEQSANLLWRFQGLAYRLSALEWQSIATAQMSSEIVENMQNTQDEMNRIMGELEQLDPNSENLPMVRQAFMTYISAATEEFKLIMAGDLEQALIVDEEHVDPAFNVFDQVLSPTSAAYSAKATQMKLVGDLGFAFVLFLNATLIALVFWRFQKVQQVIEREHLDELIAVNMERETNQKNLEQRVAERTSNLETSNQRNEHRAKQFKSIAQVARATIFIQNLEILLRDITKLISEQFGFYHVGVFLMDDSREFAVLMAANSKGGKKMLTRNHKLKVGQVGIVGYVTSSGNPRIALDTDADAVHFDNPDLPDTRSELALPLQIGKQIIGALDIQSLESNAFSQDDVQILSILADQITIAIQNARSFEESRKLLHKAQSTVSGYMTESWQALRPIQKGLGYQFSGNSIKVLESPIEGTHIKDALKKGVVIISGENADNLAIPIRLRGQVIGVMNLQNPAGQAWDQDQIDIATATAERLSLAIENATLFQTTQHRADIERVTSDISARISSSARFETILQTAAEELSRALNGSDVLVQIEPVSVKMDSST